MCRSSELVEVILGLSTAALLGTVNEAEVRMAIRGDEYRVGGSSLLGGNSASDGRFRSKSLQYIFSAVHEKVTSCSLRIYILEQNVPVGDGF